MPKSIDRRERPVYTVPDAARYLGIPSTTLYSWVSTEDDEIAPLEHVDQESRLLSFFDLIEAHILRATRERNVPRKRILRGIRFLKEARPGVARPLLEMDLYTHGNDLLAKGMLGPDDEALTNASRLGQTELEEVIKEHLRLIDHDDLGLPTRLYPKTGNRIVSITFDVLSGRPVIDGTRISTHVIAQRLKAGESADRLAQEYRIGKDQIEAVITYEAA